jgi:hypothetical protein
MSAIAEFKQQDWVKLLAKDGNTQQSTKAHPFQDDLSILTIHRGNAKPAAPSANKNCGDPIQQG